MQSRHQINVDDDGNKTSVVVSYEEWVRLNAQVKRLRNQLRTVTDIRDGLVEVENARRSGKKLQSLSDFIDESRS